jgi:hypothetical protein
MQRIQAMKHFGLKHTLQRFLFPFPLPFLFRRICKTIRCSCNDNRGAPITWADEKTMAAKACDRNLLAIIRVIRTYNSYLCMSAQHYVRKHLVLISVSEGGLVKPADIISPSSVPPIGYIPMAIFHVNSACITRTNTV